ncbi:MAG TPA: hypothetical protein VF221_12335 [Chloroflexota bacterium]
MSTRHPRRWLVVLITGVVMLGASGCGFPGTSNLTADQAAAAQVLDSWLQLMESNQSALGVKLVTHITKIGSANWSQLSGAALATNGVPDEQNFITWHWTVSDPRLDAPSHGGDVTIRTIKAQETPRALSPADQANGLQWDGRVKLTYAWAAGNSAYHDGFITAPATLKNGHWQIGPQSATIDWFTGSKGHPRTHLWVPIDGAASLINGSVKSELQWHELLHPSGKPSESKSTFFTDVTCEETNESDGLTFSISMAHASQTGSASIDWSPGLFHGAGSYTAQQFSSSETSQGNTAGPGVWFYTPSEFATYASSPSATVTVGKDLRTGSVRFTGQWSDTTSTFDGTLIHIQQVTYTDEYDATWVCSPTITGP